MATKKDLTVLEQDIINAQKKLDEVNAAINRDQLFKETKTKELVDLELKEKSIKKNIEKLNKELEEMTNIMEKRKSEHKTVFEAMQTEIKKTQATISSTNNILLSLEEKTKQSEATFTTKCGELDSKFKQKQIEVDIIIEGIEKMLSEKQDLLKGLEVEIASLLSKKEQLYITIQSLEDKQTDWDNIKKGIIRSSMEKDELLREIVGLELKKKSIIYDISTLQTEINSKKLEIQSLNEEIKIFEKDKNLFVQQKLSLQTREGQLNEKENYIKEKYESAGLTY